MRQASSSGIVAGIDALDRSSVFRRAVLDLSAEPTPVNVRRYLAASRLLDRDPMRGVRARRVRQGGSPTNECHAPTGETRRHVPTGAPHVRATPCALGSAGLLGLPACSHARNLARSRRCHSRATDLRERRPATTAGGGLPRMRDGDCFPTGGLMSVSALIGACLVLAMACVALAVTFASD